MKGHIQQRGENSWRLKFDAGRDEKTGKRKTQFHTFRGTKRQAQVKLAELIASVAQARYVEPHKTTVAQWVRTRVDHWEAAGDISARTAERYRELIENQIAPHLGPKPLQKLRTLDIEEWHTTLRVCGRADGKAGLAPRTIGHAHRVLGKALRDAAKNEMVIKNVVADEAAPKVDDQEMVIVRDTHASQLIDAGVDIVTISKRLGHSKPDITLRVYAHLFRKDDGKAAAAINASMSP
jgi:integrase